MIIMETINCALFLGGRILNPAIEIMPLMYVADGWILMYLHHRAMMYNIEDCIISSLGKQETYGYIMFDNDLNYLGCNNIAHQIFPELLECRVDLPIRNMSKVEVLLHWIAEYSKGVREKFSYENGDRHYQCSIERIWHKEKEHGYIVEMQEDTDRWHYMNLLSSYNSELERYAKEQEELKKQADEANKAKGEFLANMSHEIRTPINAVLGMDEMILRESREPEIQSYAADIRRAGNILLSLINDILDFSKIESGKMDIIPIEYDLGNVLCGLMDMIRSRAEEKNLLLELKVDPDTPAHLFGDEVRLRQIIINILTNAVKYTPEGKVTLTVSGKKVSEDSVQLYVSVKDTGIGIKEEDRERLFESFQRVDETRNRNIEGTGLGLSITMRLLNLMGSRLEVESTYGIGSDFYFYLEQKQMDEQIIGDIQKKIEQEKVKINISTEPFYAPEAKILVVDDNEMNLKVFLGLLKGHGMQIDTANCGKDCLSLMEQKSYHIVFMDHLMPEMDGVETLKRAKELENNLSKDAVMIVLTANAVSGAREMFLEEGFQDYLAKPIIAIQLEKMILNYLPKALIQNADSEQPELLVCESHGNAPAAKAENDIVDWERGRILCAGNEDFYTEILRTFLDAHSDTTLSQCYEASDFENYRVKVHAVKTNLANIGAVDASEMAKKLELALNNEKDVNYVKAHHEEFIRVYKKVVSKVEKYVYGE